MPSYEEIKKQIESSGINLSLLPSKELKALQDILWEDEIVEDAIRGLYNSRNGMLAATNKRLIFLDKGTLWGLKVEDFPYDKVSSIQYSTVMISVEVTIFTSGNKAKIDMVAKSECARFAEHVRARITGVSKNQAKISAEKNYSSNQGDLLEKLERLAKLKNDGILTENEFIIAKKKLLEN